MGAKKKFGREEKKYREQERDSELLLYLMAGHEGLMAGLFISIQTNTSTNFRTDVKT